MIKEFWQEVKEERKLKKQLKKQNKKRRLTGEEKAYKVFGILLGFFVLFGSIFFTCNRPKGDGEVSWGDAVGLTPEMVEELEKPVDENLILTNGKLNFDDYMSFVKVFTDAGVKCFNEDGEIIDSANEKDAYITSTVTLNDKQLGGYCRETNRDMGFVGTIDLLDLDIFSENEKTYLKTIVYCKLDKVINNTDLPNVYLTSISEIRVLSGSLAILDTTVQINQISQESNDFIVEKLDELSDNAFSTLANDTMSLYINMIKSVFNTTITIGSEALVFNPA